MPRAACFQKDANKMHVEEGKRNGDKIKWSCEEGAPWLERKVHGFLISSHKDVLGYSSRQDMFCHRNAIERRVCFKCVQTFLSKPTLKPVYRRYISDTFSQTNEIPIFDPCLFRPFDLLTTRLITAKKRQVTAENSPCRPCTFENIISIHANLCCKSKLPKTPNPTPPHPPGWLSATHRHSGRRPRSCCTWERERLGRRRACAGRRRRRQPRGRG